MSSDHYATAHPALRKALSAIVTDLGIRELVEREGKNRVITPFVSPDGVICNFDSRAYAEALDEAVIFADELSKGTRLDFSERERDPVKDLDEYHTLLARYEVVTGSDAPPGAAMRFFEGMSILERLAVLAIHAIREGTITAAIAEVVRHMRDLKSKAQPEPDDAA